MEKTNTKIIERNIKGEIFPNCRSFLESKGYLLDEEHAYETDERIYCKDNKRYKVVSHKYTVSTTMSAELVEIK